MKTKTRIAICVIVTLLCTIWIERGHAKTRKVAKARWDLYAVYPYGPMNRQDPGLCRQDGPVEATLAQGELEAVCLVLDNLAGTQTLDFRVSIRSNARDGRVFQRIESASRGSCIFRYVRRARTGEYTPPRQGQRLPMQ